MIVPDRRYATVLVANQFLAPTAMGGVLAAQPGPALLLTSHALFDAESQEVRGLCADVDVLCFNDLLDDAAQALCDRRASAALAPCLDQPVVRDTYPQEFQDLSTRLKNRALHRALAAAADGARLFHVPGLGIHDAYWRGQGSQMVAAPPPPDVAAMPADDRLLRVVRRGDQAAVFLSAVSRLRLAPGATVTEIARPSGLASLAWDNPGRARRLVAEAVAGAVEGAAWRLATTIHGYTPWMRALAPLIEVHVDGYHPPNYPRAYLDYYPETAVLRGNDPISARWFAAHGRAVRPSPLLAVPHMAPARPDCPPHGPVLVALNHAGDWSALINRADTDRLVLAAIALARRLPDVQVIVRPHPTMAMAAHEGGASLERLAGFIAGAGLANLEVSRLPLDQDFARGRLFVSEYSQVLLDALRLGRLGVAANLTGRRSFLADYVDLGLPEADSADGLVDLVAAVLADPAAAAARQDQLADRVNALMAEVRP